MNVTTFAVIGLGRFGFRIASQLYNSNRDVLACDTHEELVNAAADHVTRAVVADARSKSVLQGLGVKNCDCVIVAVGSDLESSILITMNLLSLGVNHIICKANNETHREILEKLGVEHIIIPEHEVADRLARNLISRNVLEYVGLSDDFSIAEREPPKSWQGKTILELNIRSKYSVNIVAIKRGDATIVAPGAGQSILPGDVLVLLGKNDDLKKIERLKT